MNSYLTFIREAFGEELVGVSDGIVMAMSVVLGLIVIVGLISLVVSICLAISYVKYNKRQNSCGYTGEQVARKLLDKSGLQDIKVSCSGSMLFGNSYSHYFKKVRLRRRTWKKDSVTSLAMAAQKSSLAVLDKENDPDMRKRVRLTPFIYLGPLAFIPLVIIGVLLDVAIFKVNDAKWSIIFSSIGLLIYLLSFLMSILVLKTEKKAQVRSIQLMQEDGLATPEELEMCQKLFKLYNIEYVNDMIIALLELIYRVLEIIAAVQHNSSTSKS
jgi:Zn-dependent membrane protease YugP